MKTLETLLKIATKKVEESQESIAKLLRIVQGMDSREKELNGKIETENDMVSKSDDINLVSFAGAFTLKANEEITDIKLARKDAENIMVEKQELLRTRFAEQKRYEILLERKRAKLKKELQKKEQSELDDIAVMRHKA